MTKYYEYEISQNENYITFTRDHGECYGGESSSVIDTENKSGEDLYNHIKTYLGEAPAEAARENGYC